MQIVQPVPLGQETHEASDEDANAQCYAHDKEPGHERNQKRTVWRDVERLCIVKNAGLVEVIH